MRTVKINQEEINKAMDDRNSVLQAMGFDCDDSLTIEGDIELIADDSFSKYGNVVEEEVSENVFIVSYENNDLYISDLRNKNKGFFVGD